MTKVNVNTAGREELVEVAGLRPELAEAILRFRGEHGGEIASADALGELPGVGPATLEQLRKSLAFGERGGNGDARVTREGERRGGAGQPTRAMAEAVRNTTRAGAEASKATAEFGRAVLDLVEQQTRHNLETWTALATSVRWDQAIEAMDWDRVFQIQGEFWRVSLERAARLNQRCLEVSQAVLTAAGTASRQDELRRAA
jgi:competence ComEA-like helix-hairpin-helix protein